MALDKSAHWDSLWKQAILKRPRNGSLGFSVKGPRIWGCERAAARSHPQIREFTTDIPKETEKSYEITGTGIITGRILSDWEI